MLKNILLAGVALALLSSCDSGDIYEQEGGEQGGLTCKINAVFKNVASSTWPKDYQIVIASYTDDPEYPASFLSIEKPATNDTVSISLSNIPESAEYVTISLVNKGRKRVCDFIMIPNEDGAFKANSVMVVDLLDYNRVQNQFFSNCVNCHGGGERVAANLNLTEGNSYGSIVDKNSTKEPSMKLIASGDVDNSFILKVLETDVSASWHYNHRNVSFNSEDEDIALLKSWISSLK